MQENDENNKNPRGRESENPRERVEEDENAGGRQFERTTIREDDKRTRMQENYEKMHWS